MDRSQPQKALSTTRRYSKVESQAGRPVLVVTPVPSKSTVTTIESPWLNWVASIEVAFIIGASATLVVPSMRWVVKVNTPPVTVSSTSRARPSNMMLLSKAHSPLPVKLGTTRFTSVQAIMMSSTATASVVQTHWGSPAEVTGAISKKRSMPQAAITVPEKVGMSPTASGPGMTFVPMGAPVRPPAPSPQKMSMTTMSSAGMGSSATSKLPE